MQNQFCDFSAEWVTDPIQSNGKSCKIGLASKFSLKVITTELFNYMKSFLWQVILKVVAFELFE